MIFAHRRKVRKRSHCPLKVAKIIGVAVAEPERLMKIGAAACNPAVRAGEVGGIVHRPKGVFTSLPIARPLGVKRVDRRPSAAVAAQPRSRATALAVRRSLFVDGPGSEEWPAPKP